MPICLTCKASELYVLFKLDLGGADTLKKIPYLVLLLFVAFHGCSSPVSSDTKPKNALTGNWVGTMAIPDLNQSGTLSFTISQSGTTFSGTFTTSTHRFGTISGSQNGSSVSATLTFQDNCQGSAQLSGTLSSDAKSVFGNGTTNDCIGSYSFTFTVAKQ